MYAQKALRSFALDLIDRLFPYEPTETLETIELPLPVLQKGDVIVSCGFEVEVVEIAPSPYVFCPPEFEDYGNGGEWVYLWREETREVEWMPLAALAVEW